MLRLAGRWDKIGRLLVVAQGDVDPADVSGVFGVLKKEGDERIRQIINRKRRNAREYPLEGRSLGMPHGILLCQLPLEKDRVARASLDDLSSFFHAFAVTDAKARGNVVGGAYSAGEVASVSSQGHKFAPDARVRLCLKGLSMGDHHTPDIAQEAHENVLRAAGCLRHDEALEYRRPIPETRSGYYDGGHGR